MNDKIKALMLKSGLSAEATDGLCEAIDSHLADRYKRQDAEFNAKLNKAKKVCLEEVESHKRDLARRLQIFAEAKGASIETTIAKQTAIKESAALAKLKDVQALLHNVPLNGEPNGTLQAENVELKRRVKTLKEQVNQTTEQANRANAIAQKALSRNRQLEAAVVESKRAPAQAAPTKPIAKNAGRPVSTRPTLIENQERSRQTAADGFNPAGIAALLD